MRVLILWSRISGYMAACWDRFAEMEGVELRVVAWASSQMDDSVFDSTVTATANCHLLSPDEREDRAIVESEIRSFQPDVIVVPGWLSAAYRSCIEALPSKRPLVVMGMDTPWNGRLRQHFTRWRYRKLFANVDRVVVAGERTWQYARRLGFLEQQISRGVYGWDESSFTQNQAVVASDPSFVFVGRLAEEKGIRALLSAYQNYQDEVKIPWRLTICGTGPLQPLIDAEHVEYLGFVQPRDLPGVLRQSSVMVLPSSYEPWGVALAEAMGSGLPVIATEACGAAVDLIRPFWNGLLVPTNSVSALRESFLWFHSNRNRVSEMGQNARKAAEPFSASNWAVRWFEMLTRLVGQNAAVTARRAA